MSQPPPQYPPQGPPGGPPPGYGPPPGGPPPGPPGGPPPGYGPPPGGAPGGPPPGYGPPPGGQWGPGVPPGAPQQNKSPLPIILGVALLLLVVGGGVWFITSGDDDDSSGGGRGASLSSDEQEYAEAIASVAEQDPDFIDDDDPFGEEAIPCLAELVVELAGVDRLAEVGTPDEFRSDPDLLDEFDDLFDDNLSRQEAELAYDTVGGCVDWEEAFISEGIPGVSESELRCVVGNLESGALEELFINVFMGQMGNPEAERQFEAAGRACGLD